jgi:hypothetical protein
MCERLWYGLKKILKRGSEKTRITQSRITQITRIDTMSTNKAE